MDEYDAAPRITEILQRVFPVKAGRPIAQIINYLSASDSSSARLWLQEWKKISEKDRIVLPIEAVCIMAGVSPLEILGAVLMAAKNLKAQESALSAILAHPDVLKSTIKASKGKFGFSDRKLLHEAVGFLPTKNGQSIAINIGGSKSDDDEDSDDDDKAFDDAFPTISGKLEVWESRRRSLTDGR